MKFLQKKEPGPVEYNNLVEKFRTYYKTKYGINLDDDIIYMIIRINEGQIDLKKDIRNISKVSFRSGWDYFLYGLAGSLKWLWVLLSILALSSIIVYYTERKLAVRENQKIESSILQEKPDVEKNQPKSKTQKKKLKK